MSVELPAPQIRQKPVRTFVIRAGRATEGQRKALEFGWPVLGLDLESGQAGYDRAFSRQAPRVLEIGYGMGQSLLEMAQAEPEKDFIGVEVHPPGVGSLLLGAYDLVMSEVRAPNLKTYMADATDVLRECVPPGSLHRVQLYFPDPWPKKKHHKRRIVQPELIHLMAERLQPGGVIHLATDWHPYAQWMMEILEAEPLLKNGVAPGEFAPRPTWRPQTKFEKRGERLGHSVADLIYYRQS